jgi:hypothetical protein
MPKCKLLKLNDLGIFVFDIRQDNLTIFVIFNKYCSRIMHCVTPEDSTRMGKEEYSLVEDQNEVNEKYHIYKGSSSHFSKNNKILVYQNHNQTDGCNQILDYKADKRGSINKGYHQWIQFSSAVVYYF